MDLRPSSYLEDKATVLGHRQIHSWSLYGNDWTCAWERNIAKFLTHSVSLLLGIMSMFAERTPPSSVLQSTAATPERAMFVIIPSKLSDYILSLILLMLQWCVKKYDLHGMILWVLICITTGNLHVHVPLKQLTQYCYLAWYMYMVLLFSCSAWTCWNDWCIIFRASTNCWS
jgi:hypothetical protein